MRFVIPLLAALLFLTGCSGPYSNPATATASTEKPLVVSVQTIAVESLPEVIVANGELFAEDVASIGVKVPGRLMKLNVDLGSQVTAGQVLGELEKDDYEFRVKQAEGQVEQTRAQLGIGNTSNDTVVPENTAMVRQAAAGLREATLIGENTTKLFQQGVLSRVDNEKAGVTKQAAEARYQAAMEQVAQLRAQLIERRAQLALARQQLSDTVIKAPFSGGVTKRQSSVGEYLVVNSPVATIVRQHPLRIRLEVPEKQAAKVKFGQLIEIDIQGGQGRRTGRVVRLSPAIDAQSRSLTVEGEIPNEDGKVRPGSFAEGRITVNAAASGITVPFSSVVSFAGTERVFVVNKGALEDHVIQTGRRLPGDRVEVLEGIEANSKVVIKATDRMMKGQKVTIAGS